MTAVRAVPLHAGILSPDPYAEKNRPWRFYAMVAVIVLLMLAWAMGRLDRYLPERIRAQTIIGTMQKP
jgi:hypothetical protein